MVFLHFSWEQTQWVDFNKNDALYSSLSWPIEGVSFLFFVCYCIFFFTGSKVIKHSYRIRQEPAYRNGPPDAG